LHPGYKSLAALLRRKQGDTIMTSSYSKYHELAVLVTLVSINLIMWVLLISSLIAWFGADPAI
jgi:hypothetical protein